MINLIIFIAVIFLILVILKKYEHFQSKNIEFIAKNKVCFYLKKIKDKYKYNPLDIKLRKIDKKYRDNIYKFYCDNILNLNELDIKLLLWCFNEMKTKIKDQNLKFDLLFIFDDIKIAKFNNTVDNGYPHTNLNIIFLTSNFINQIIPYFNRNDSSGMIEHVGSVLIHECIHIWQRKDPQLFDKLYKKYWNFTNPSHIYNKHNLDKITRFNPDGKNTNWVFNFRNKHILFLSVYQKTASNIGNVRYVGIYLKKEGNNYYVEDNKPIEKLKGLTTIDEFNYFFEHLYGNHYHPNEISAELLSIYYLKIMKISHKKYTNIGFKNMMIWLRNNL